MPELDKNSVPVAGEPLPIWFFVGLILLVYGALVIVGSAFSASHPTMLAEMKPGYWWGAIILVSGAVFLGIGLKGRGK
jgi:Ca2+/Na+ antiporter